MHKFAVAGAFGALIAGALVAHVVNLSARRPVAQAAVVAPFEIMLKARNLPVETFDAV